jgi:hypothetical protein
MKKGRSRFVIAALSGREWFMPAQNVIDPGWESNDIGILSTESLIGRFDPKFV